MTMTDTTPMVGTWLYFLGLISPSGEKFIKIGKSRQPRSQRLQQHRLGDLTGESRIELLCEVRGQDPDETTLHQYFSSANHRNETFRATSHLLDYIRWLRDEWYVAVEEDDDEERNSKPIVEADQWLPAEGRFKTKDPSLIPGLTYGEFDLGPRHVTVDDYYTNQVIIEAARRTFGSIDLDPASHAVANKVVRATRFFTKSDNGLVRDWSGNVWLNPPFSEWQPWAEKVLKEVDGGAVRQLCVMAATRTITAKYFAPLLANSQAIVIFNGRIALWGGKAIWSPNDGHVVLYFGPNRENFQREFADLGTVFLR